MRKFFTIILSLIAISTFAKVEYAEHSVLKEGNWIKVAVKETGIHKITYQQNDSVKTKNYSSNIF